MPPEEESALERMRSRLYDPKGQNAVVRSTLPTHAADIPRAWDAPPPPAPHMTRTRAKLPFVIRFLVAAVIFFIIAGSAAAYFLFVGGFSVSTDNINISIDGPTTAASGDTVPLLVTIENHNPVAITSTSLDIDFPEGTRSADDPTKAYARYTDTLGDMNAGQASTRQVSAVLFGSENQTITIPVKFEYRTANSNAVFVKEKDYVVTITSSPVSITATSVSQISSGQPLTLSISVRSNATKPLTDLALKADYPFGFAISSASIPVENGLFPIGTLTPGQEKKLVVTGTLSGEDSDARVFHWTIGSVASSTNGAIGVTYAVAESDIALSAPFLDVGLSLNGSTAAPTVSAGGAVQGIVSWKNTLPTSVLNGVITVSLSGTGYDPASVSTQGGFYQSSNGTIRFDSTTDSGLANLSPGDTGQGTFSFKIKPASVLSGLSSPSVTLMTSASGRRVNETGVSETLNSTLSRTVKISSGLALSSKILKTTGPFTDPGPWPPTVGTETMYTVMLTAANGVNSTAGTVVTMTLPSYVRFTGLANPADGSITYVESTRTVKWNAGDLSGNATKQGAFQIAFLPSISQQGSTPTLVSAQTLTGTDRFTQTNITSTANALDIAARFDPAYQSNDGSVQ